MTKLLDVNILIYAQGSAHPLRMFCQRILKAAAAHPDAYAINTEILQEIAYVYTRRGERQRAIATVTAALNLFSRILPVTQADIVVMRDLMQQVQHTSPRDAIHAAVILNNGLTGHWSALTPILT